MRALVTGAGVRVGRALSIAFAEAGFDVVVHYNREAGPAEEVVEHIRGLGREALLIAADLGEPEGCAALVQGAGAVDVLVNSAAIWSRVPLSKLDAQAFDSMMAINARAPLLLALGLAAGLSRSALPGGGLVLNIADIAADRPVPGYAHYCASKAALLSLTRSLALELAPSVRVNAISPGAVLAPLDMDAETVEAIRQTVPAGRFGTAEDVARLAVFLALHAPYVSGQDIAVDGGRSVVPPSRVG